MSVIGKQEVKKEFELMSVSGHTTLQSDQTFVVFRSEVPYHSRILQEYCVQPPEKADRSAISRLLVVDKGIYTARYERSCAGENELGTLQRKDTDSALGEQSLDFDWTMANIEYYPLKTRTAPSDRSTITPQ